MARARKAKNGTTPFGYDEIYELHGSLFDPFKPSTGIVDGAVVDRLLASLHPKDYGYREAKPVTDDPSEVEAVLAKFERTDHEFDVAASAAEALWLLAQQGRLEIDTKWKTIRALIEVVKRPVLRLPRREVVDGEVTWGCARIYGDHRGTAVRALGAMGPEAKVALPVLFAIWREPKLKESEFGDPPYTAARSAIMRLIGADDEIMAAVERVVARYEAKLTRKALRSKRA